MNSADHSERLRILSKEYYQGHINFNEYREKRNIVLDDMDVEYNGRQPTSIPILDDDSSLFSKAIDLFKKIEPKE